MPEMRRSYLHRFCLSVLGATLSVLPVYAQNPSDQGPITPTIRVYANRVQIPVLVLRPDRDRIFHMIAPDRFFVNFDGGPWFRATNARLEGDDPLDLAIFLDTRSPTSDLLPDVDKAVAALAPGFLHSQDHVSIYAMECSTLHIVRDVAANPSQLKDAVDLALQSWVEHKRTKTPVPCPAGSHLWDSLAYVSSSLATHPGRRVIVALTEGDDDRSKLSLEQVIGRIQNDSVAIIGLNPLPSTPIYLQSQSTSLPDLFAELCESTGGLMAHLGAISLTKSMQRVTTMLRERYIVEFRRPANATSGKHELGVRIDKSNYFIRPAGDQIPLQQAASKDDPNVILADDSQAPWMGKTGAKTRAQQLSANLPQAVAQQVEAPAQQQAKQQIQQPSQQPVPQVEELAQQPAQPIQVPQPAAASNPSSAAVLKVSTKLTIEEVTVSDARNQPIHGLKEADFSLKEDGKLQPIKNFAEYGTEISTAQPASSPVLPPNIFTNLQSPGPTTSAVNVILLDEVTTGLADGLTMAPENFAYARQSSISFIRNMPPGTKVAVLVLGDRLHLAQPVTSDRDVLISAINAVHYTPVVGAYVVSAGQGCEAANQQSRLTVEALAQAASFLSGIAGRKNLIWFTPGIPWLTEYPQFSMFRCLNDESYGLHKDYGLLADQHIALYPIDPRGLKACGGNVKSNAPAFVNSCLNALQEEHNSLRDLADAGGGLASLDRNDLDAAVREAVATGSDYYSLAYTPPLSKYDGKYHKIEVKLDRPGVRLQYREGYTAVDPAAAPKSAAKAAAVAATATTPASQFLAAMGHGALPATQLPFTVQVQSGGKQEASPTGTISPALKGKQLVPYTFTYALDADQIALSEQRLLLRFDTVAYGEDGTPLNIASQGGSLTVKPEQMSLFQSKPFQFTQQLDLPPGKVFVRVGILDLNSNKMGTLEILLTVPKP